MDKVTVNQLAEEFHLDSKTILKELKKIGVMVFSANQPIDPRFVGKVHAHLRLLSNLTQEEEKRAERKKQISKKRIIKIKPKKPELAPLDTALSKDMTIRKAQRTEEALEAVEQDDAEETVVIDESTDVEAQVSLSQAAVAETEQDLVVETSVTPKEEKTGRAAVIEPEEKKPIRKASKEIIEEIARKAKLDKQGKPAAELIKPEIKEKPELVKPVEGKDKEAIHAAEKPGLIVREIQKEKKKEKGKVLKRSTTASMAPQSDLERGLSLFKSTDAHRRRGKKKYRKQRMETVAHEEIRVAENREMTKITLPEGLSVKEISERMSVPVRDIMKFLFMKGIMVNINQLLDVEVVDEIGHEFGFEVTPVSIEDELFQKEFLVSDTDLYIPRPPIITVMGHVDHGKTSLLDAIRKTMVAAGEAGGITQHIGAYQVEIKDRKITFIDTPGHEAFTMMRARGAQVTDIVVLVVAADDGVMPQTVEAVQHARAAQVPIIVAINKIDKPNANPERVKRDLADMELIPEEWGGKTIFVEVSAKKIINIDHLLEMILLVADMQELKANPNTLAMGTVLESRVDQNRGTIATLLVQNGTLFERDIIVAGSITGKIRAMYDENNKRLDDAVPSTPVMVMGLDDLPTAGERFFATDDAVKARQLSLHRQQKQREEQLKKKNTRVSLETLFQRLQEGQIKELPIILKVDVQGSKDAIESLLNKLSTDKVKINILHSAVGAINENDVLLASASNAIIVGFSVKPVRSAEEIATRENVDIRFYNIIYNIADEIKKAMEGLLEYTNRESVIGTVEVRETFRIPGVGTVVGGYVSDGNVRRDAYARLFRDGVMVYNGKISSLKRFKEDVTEVKNSFECGVSVEKFNDFKIGDELQIYVIEKVKDTLDS